MKSFSMKKVQRGFTLIEIMITLAIIGAAVAVVLVYQSRAESSSKVSQTVTAMTNMTSKIKAFYAPAASYTGITPAQVNAMGLVTQPLTWDTTNVRDAWGNAMTITGNAAATTPTFVITLGGATTPLTVEECVSLATNLANGADVVDVGATTGGITTANGVLGLGTGKSYKAAGVPLSMTNLTDATACGATNPTIGLQYH